ncbi:MAG TPA: indole-3-glycerol phosphate synthase TrpC [Candidatus Limnocylindrales bacterium]|nr:indole-3-glycerol phosphate synthase TrpC [Candidatus Limnocylindrales bacterium]
MRTGTILDQILARKVEEVAVLRTQAARLHEAATEATPPRGFFAALAQGEQVALIAEIKKASPSKGVLIEDFDPAALAQTYANHGAMALSVLTDADYFQGSLAFLDAARTACPLPALRKDFIIDALQVLEGRAAGADAMLLIAAALDDAQMADLHTLITELGMAALVEVHDEHELEQALALKAALIGVNNRDLRTFVEDLGLSERLAGLMPVGQTWVAESAIRSRVDVARMGAAGASAVLVGEGLVAAGDIGAQVRAFSSQPRTMVR